MAIRLTSNGLEGLTYVNETKYYSGSSYTMRSFSVWSIGYTKIFASEEGDLMTLKAPSSGTYYVLFAWASSNSYVHSKADTFISGGSNLVTADSAYTNGRAEATLFRLA